MLALTCSIAGSVALDCTQLLKVAKFFSILGMFMSLNHMSCSVMAIEE